MQACKPDFFEQLQKIPQLVSHYHHHIYEEGEKISFLDFLKMHYKENSTHKQAEDHSSLPLFTHCFHCCVIVVETGILSIPKPVVEFISKESLFYYSLNYKFILGKGIFQPPKFS